MRIVLVAALVLAGCVEGETPDIPDHDGGWEADSFSPDSEIDAADPLPDAEPPADAEPPPCNVLAWPDADGDGYGDKDAEPVEACDEIPVGYVANADDCYDGNALARPGQTNTYVVHRGDGSFDYDCDGVETKNWPDMQICTDLEANPPVEGFRGWKRICLFATAQGCHEWSGVPDCGESGAWAGSGYCPYNPANQVTQRCR